MSVAPTAPPVGRAPAAGLPGAEGLRTLLAGRTGALLAAHVPLTLLLDLADPLGPDSADLLATEAGCADWLR